MSKNIFTGTMPALMTPCKTDRTPDFAALVKKGKEMIAAGMSAVVYCGSMGDWPLLTACDYLIDSFFQPRAIPLKNIVWCCPR